MRFKSTEKYILNQLLYASKMYMTPQVDICTKENEIYIYLSYQDYCIEDDEYEAEDEERETIIDEGFDSVCDAYTWDDNKEYIINELDEITDEWSGLYYTRHRNGYTFHIDATYKDYLHYCFKRTKSVLKSDCFAVLSLIIGVFVIAYPIGFYMGLNWFKRDYYPDLKMEMEILVSSIRNNPDQKVFKFEFPDLKGEYDFSTDSLIIVDRVGPYATGSFAQKLFYSYTQVPSIKDIINIASNSANFSDKGAKTRTIIFLVATLVGVPQGQEAVRRCYYASKYNVHHIVTNKIFWKSHRALEDHIDGIPRSLIPKQ